MGLVPSNGNQIFRYGAATGDVVGCWDNWDMTSASTWQRRWRLDRDLCWSSPAYFQDGQDCRCLGQCFCWGLIQWVTHTRGQHRNVNAKKLLMLTLWKMICLSNLRTAGNVTEPREAGISFTPCNSSFKLLKMFRLQTKLQWPISWSYHDPLLHHGWESTTCKNWKRNLTLYCLRYPLLPLRKHAEGNILARGRAFFQSSWLAQSKAVPSAATYRRKAGLTVTQNELAVTSFQWVSARKPHFCRVCRCISSNNRAQIVLLGTKHIEHE